MRGAIDKSKLNKKKLKQLYSKLVSLTRIILSEENMARNSIAKVRADINTLLSDNITVSDNQGLEIINSLRLLHNDLLELKMRVKSPKVKGLIELLVESRFFRKGLVPLAIRNIKKSMR